MMTVDRGNHIAHGKLWSLWDMFSLNGSRFLDTVLEIRRIKTHIETWGAEGRQEEVTTARAALAEQFRELAMASEAVQAKLAGVAARRMADELVDEMKVVRMHQIRSAIEDVESRLRDELQQVAIIVMHSHETMLMGSANELASGWDINALYPDAARELEEAAKCLAFERPTAAVFHAMRLLEVGLKALAAHLEIDDPTHPAKRNWAIMLREIKNEIDVKFMKGSDAREKHERLYASLDAVRNPWRNGSIHVTSFYSGQEALHILRCSIFFLQMLASVTNPKDVEEPETQEIDGLPVA